MSNRVTKILIAAACGAGLALACSAAVAAQGQSQQSAERAPKRSTPDNFSWDYGPGGKIVKKSRIVAKSDGTVREETAQGGKCVKVIERSEGEKRQVDAC